ncbi:hypothetical protein WJX72_008958 [[Myrmecia] bisecta]|uniref:Protein kinase domain-containing protein n=1 Tax=[Myrmecia] bisecta TaxID=41462 RepID=A0AAW1PQ12_9CHLO
MQAHGLWILAASALGLAQLAYGICPGASYSGTNYTTNFSLNGADNWQDTCDGSVVSGCTSACCVSATVQNCIPCGCANTAGETVEHGRYRRAACQAIQSTSTDFCTPATVALNSFLSTSTCYVDIATQLTAFKCGGTPPASSTPAPTPGPTPAGTPAPTPAASVPSPSPVSPPPPSPGSPPPPSPVSPPPPSPVSPSPTPAVPSPAPPAPPPSHVTVSSSSAGIGGGAIAGIAIGAIAGVTLLAALVVVIVMRRRRRDNASKGGLAASGQGLGPDPELAAGFKALEPNPFVVGQQQRPQSVKLVDYFDDEDSKTSSGFKTDTANGNGPTTRTQKSASLRVVGAPLDTETTIGLAHVLRSVTSEARPAVPGDSGGASVNTPHTGDSTGSSTASRSDPSKGLPENYKIESSQLQIYRHPGTGMLVRLGVGGQGEVYKGLLNGVDDVAVKVMSSDSLDRQARFLREIAVTANLRNKNVVPFFGACIVDESVALVMDYMPGGDLFKKIQNDQTREYGWYKRGHRIALGIAKGLVYLHSLNPPILHMDLKTPNILLDSHDEPKIADIGLGKRLEGNFTIASCAGSYHWASPEQARGESVNMASDIFSLGVIIWEICTGCPPMRGRLRAVRVEGSPLVPGEEAECPAEIGALIFGCMQDRPEDRPTARAVHDTIAAWEKKHAAPTQSI